MDNYEDTAAAVKGGKRVRIRDCRVCKDPIEVVMHNNQPHISSCTCRPSGERALVAASWKDIEEIFRPKQS